MRVAYRIARATFACVGVGFVVVLSIGAHAIRRDERAAAERRAALNVELADAVHP